MNLQPYQKTILNAFRKLKSISFWPNKRKTPETLEECHEWLTTNLRPEEILEIKNSSLSGLCKYHHTMGRWIRNHWKLWEGGELKSHMESLGFTHPDDMSSVILDSFWSKLNGQVFDTKKAAEEYADFWEKSKTNHSTIIIRDGKIIFGENNS